VAFKGIIAAAASVALMTTPTLAAAQASASASASSSREVAPAAETVEGDQLRGGWIIPLIALIAIILGICAATDICGGDDGDPPTSP
jgi:cytochrome c oxidase assembly factor CtaG